MRAARARLGLTAIARAADAITAGITSSDQITLIRGTCSRLELECVPLIVFRGLLVLTTQ